LKREVREMKMLKKSKAADRIRYAMFRTMYNKQGMEMVQVAILVAIAVAVGVVFSGLAKTYVNNIFDGLTTDF
jgi:hypothetical protein